MTTSTPDTEPRRIAVPVLRAGRPYCPRCEAALRFAHDEYACLACGYEYVLSEDELARLAGGRQPLRPAAAISGIPLAALVGAGSFLALGLVLALIALLVLRRSQRSAVT